ERFEAQAGAALEDELEVWRPRPQRAGQFGVQQYAAQPLAGHRDDGLIGRAGVELERAAVGQRGDRAAEGVLVAEQNDVLPPLLGELAAAVRLGGAGGGPRRE